MRDDLLTETSDKLHCVTFATILPHSLVGELQPVSDS